MTPTCDTNSKIVNLTLSDFDLSGTFPVGALIELDNLVHHRRRVVPLRVVVARRQSADQRAQVRQAALRKVEAHLAHHRSVEPSSTPSNERTGFLVYTQRQKWRTGRWSPSPGTAC